MLILENASKVLTQFWSYGLSADVLPSVPTPAPDSPGMGKPEDEEDESETANPGDPGPPILQREDAKQPGPKKEA